MSKVVVVGAGPMGLACALSLLKHGHQVTLYEADDRPGGMSAHFDFDGLDIERFYHFVCAPDQPLFDLLRELGLEDELCWSNSKMGFFYHGKLYDWGNPIALLRFPHFSLISKIRYGLHILTSTYRRGWQDLDGMDAVEWVRRWVGEEVYEAVWRPLFDLKFFEYTNNLSAAWIWSRIRRMGRSRGFLVSERLGYLRGGSQTLLRKMVSEIERLGGTLHLSHGAQEVEIEDARVTGVRTATTTEPCDFVATTIPMPHVPRLVPALSEALKQRYTRLDNIGAVCVIMKLKQRVSEYFWLNTTDPEIEIPGVIEYSNLQPLSDPVVYIPYYLPQDHPKFANSDEEFIAESLGYLKRINPEISDESIKAVRVSRLRYAQPICPPRFRDLLPPIETEVRGLYIADTSYCYPEDRSISSSVEVGAQLAQMINRSSIGSNAE